MGSRGIRERERERERERAWDLESSVPGFTLNIKIPPKIRVIFHGSFSFSRELRGI